MGQQRPITQIEARRIRQAAHHQARLEDFTARLGAWGVVLAWTEEARRIAKQHERRGDEEPVAELARLLESYCAHYRL
ncbi:hypothetical protein AB0G74_27670 [Streptomyces sp. NPDC020875]|uniref:hypothetical protein n=1 Tax=Streptomyces sp. NPDC020875 TaxID=3154898 RepID=UPI003409747E